MITVDSSSGKLERMAPSEEREAVHDMEAARLARLHAYREMTMSERLARAHELCAQLARLKPVERRAP